MRDSLERGQRANYDWTWENVNAIFTLFHLSPPLNHNFPVLAGVSQNFPLNFVRKTRFFLFYFIKLQNRCIPSCSLCCKKVKKKKKNSRTSGAQASNRFSPAAWTFHFFCISETRTFHSTRHVIVRKYKKSVTLFTIITHS